MKILSVSFTLLPVGADAGGGAEQILWNITRGIVAAGHQSIVVAARGSHVSGCLLPTACANGNITDDIRRAAYKEHRAAIETLIDSSSLDLIHFHGLDFPEYLPAGGPPMLATLHLPVDWYPRRIFEHPGLTVNFVSHTQAGLSPSQRAWPLICNGVDLGRFRCRAPKESFALVLSRICPEKGIDVALRIAHRLDLQLLVAGPVHPFAAHQTYFQEQVKPLLDHRRRYVGPVGGDEKLDLLAKASCLILPSSVAETSSLVAMEAIASGTPVVAFRSGALPEVVDHGMTGFVVDSEDKMVDALRRVHEITPECCRTVAEERFDAQRMIRDYLALYETLR